MTKTAKLSKADLMHFTGSEHWYRHALNRNVLFTDGTKYVADEGGAYWFLETIPLLQLSNKRIGAEEFQVWKLAVGPERGATLTCEDGNYNVVYTQQLEFTDFPAPEITLWFENNTSYLPSER